MLVGLIPMGGQAERWAPLVTPKELLPIGQRSDGRPLMLVDCVLEAMLAADVELIVIPITPVKADIVMRYLGTHLANGALISYITAPGPTLVANLAACAGLLQGHDVLFGMPDTIFTPVDILHRCYERLGTDIELSLGVFPSTEQEELDVVDHSDGWAHAIRPKPRPPGAPAGDVWGVAAWTSSFTERLRCWPANATDPLGEVFQAATTAKRNSCAVALGHTYADLGCYDRYRDALIGKSVSLSSALAAGT